MEFEELKKIWDTQNNETLYVINEEALHKRIRVKRNRARWISNTNEIGLIVIAVVTSSLLFIIGSGSIYSYLSAFAMLLIGVYVLLGRIRRKRRENQFDRSILGDLDEAISNVSNEISRAKTFVWWFIVPVAIPALLNISQGDASLWKWLLMPFAFALSYFLVRWELSRVQIPRKKELLSLRDKLTEEIDDVHVDQNE